MITYLPQKVKQVYFTKKIKHHATELIYESDRHKNKLMRNIVKYTYVAKYILSQYHWKKKLLNLSAKMLVK